MTHRFELTVLYDHITPRLALEVISDIYTKPSITLYHVVLVNLLQIETQLNDGRFLYYDRSPQDHILTYTPESYDPVAINYFTERLNWISNNVFNTWSVDIVMQHVSYAVFYWSFENADDALLFKLTF